MQQTSTPNAGDRLRERLSGGKILAVPGVYDVFSATLVGSHFDAVFCSGYGLSASYYGLPDAGYISASDVISNAGRVRAVLPATHILVDIDDGFGGADVACDVIKRLELANASAVMMEDQRRPKKCGHLDGKEIVPMDDYITRLTQVLARRASIFVLARTDASNLDEGILRAKAFAAAGADAVMVEGIRDLRALEQLRATIPDNVSIAVNLILGGKTQPVTLTSLANAGANLAIYSTPCLYAAHAAIESTIQGLLATDGLLGNGSPSVTLAENNAHLQSVQLSRFGPQSSEVMG